MKFYLLFVGFISILRVNGQEIPEVVQQQIEAIGEELPAGENELDQIPANKLVLNSASYSELKAIPFLSDNQIQQFIDYRKSLGALISIYELQAIPGWDIETIRLILPWVELGNNYRIDEEIFERFRSGQHTLLVRMNHSIDELSKNPGLFIRYKYSFKDRLQYSMVAESDAGEKIFSSAAKGFDFYSAGLFLRNIGCVRAIALGDYTVNLGQGLIHWQSLALKKSGDPMMVRRASAVLKPYSSGGEFNFHRGAGITLGLKNFSSTVFISLRKLDATIRNDEFGNKYFTSFRESGYHRTPSEIASRNNLRQIFSGMNLKMDNKNLQVGLSVIYVRYSIPANKAEEPYQHFTFKGNNWFNAAIDYSYTWKNLHFYGETAIDKQFAFGSINGILLSLDKHLDMSLVCRHISPEFQSLKGNAFTESSSTGNEKGVYYGIRYTVNNKWRLDAYIDFFRFPWLRYQVSAPSIGNEYMMMISYQLSKQASCYFRFRRTEKEEDVTEALSPVQNPGIVIRLDWRMHFSHEVDQFFSWQLRIDYAKYQIEKNIIEPGFLAYLDCRLSDRLFKDLDVRLRWQVFEVRNYNSRIYTYENNFGVFSAPAYSGNGKYLFFITTYKWKKKLILGLRYGRLKKLNELTDLMNNVSEIKHEFKGQIQYLF